MMVYKDFVNKVVCGNALEVLKRMDDECVQMCVTSPPYYGLRDYKVKGQIGLEETHEIYVQKIVGVFREVKRVLKDDGTLWLNLGDSYNGSGGNHKPWHKNDTGFQCQKVAETYKGRGNNILSLKPKDLIGIPWRVAFALQADGWYLRQDIIWHKPNPMPESVTDRCTKSHEYLFLLAKSQKYYFDNDSIRESSMPESIAHHTKYAGKHYRKKEYGDDLASVTKWEHRAPNPLGRNKRSVLTITTKPFKEAHFATFPPYLIKPCILAGSKIGDIILDPFFGSGTTVVVSWKLNRRFIGIELNPDYCRMAEERLKPYLMQSRLFHLNTLKNNEV